MKKLLLIAFSLFYLSNLSAQTCSPDTSLVDTLIISPLPFDTILNPTGGISECAVVDEYFEFPITFKPPATFTYLGITTELVHIRLPTEDGISNLPGDFDYICNPPNCTFESDTLGCLLIFGTPTQADTGRHELSINAFVQTTLLPQSIPFSFPDNTIAPGHYYQYIIEPGEECPAILVANSFLEQNVSIKISPNPFSSQARLEVNSDISGKFQFVITNITGARVYNEAIHLLEGENVLEFDGSNLAEGIYFYSITNGKAAVSGKMVVNR